MEIRNSVSIITGGSSGLGLGTTQLFASLGGRVAIFDLSPPKTPLAGTEFFVCDVTNENQVIDQVA
jgi:NAD(P)-dependent dehydrogenase (short-subunit alcohol dehydrogenase family)